MIKKKKIKMAVSNKPITDNNDYYYRDQEMMRVEISSDIESEKKDNEKSEIKRWWAYSSSFLSNENGFVTNLELLFPYLYFFFHP